MQWFTMPLLGLTVHRKLSDETAKKANEILKEEEEEVVEEEKPTTGFMNDL